MFREMRRKNQILKEEEAIAILEKGKSGVLDLLGDEEYPYAVPISYVYCDSKIYFHGAKSGHKIDAIKKCEKASFCVIDQDQIVPEKYTTYFRSVIAFGKIRMIENEINPAMKSLCMMEFQIEHLTGKEAIELVRARISE